MIMFQRVRSAKVTFLFIVQMSCASAAVASGESLKAAARRGDTLAMVHLLAGDEQVDRVDESGNTALITAAFHGQPKSVELLLAAGAVAEEKAHNGYTAFDYAIENRHRPVVEILLGHWQEKAIREGNLPESNALKLTLAAVKADTKEILRLLDVGACPNLSNRSGYSPLAMAASWGHGSVLRLLLAWGSDPGLATRSRYGSTPLMEGTRNGNVAIARLLVNAGAPVNQPDEYGDHALNWATFFGQYEMVKFLVKAGSRLDVVGQTPDTALQIAIREKHRRIEAFLRAAGREP